MQNPIKQIAAWVLGKELTALKNRLSEASTALDKIADDMVALPKEVTAEVEAVATKVLSTVLSSADKVRAKVAPIEAKWAQDLYIAYQGTADYTKLTVQRAETLAKDAEQYLGKL